MYILDKSSEHAINDCAIESVCMNGKKIEIVTKSGRTYVLNEYNTESAARLAFEFLLTKFGV